MEMRSGKDHREDGQGNRHLKSGEDQGADRYIISNGSPQISHDQILHITEILDERQDDPIPIGALRFEASPEWHGCPG